MEDNINKEEKIDEVKQEKIYNKKVSLKKHKRSYYIVWNCVIIAALLLLLVLFILYPMNLFDIIFCLINIKNM